MSRIVIIAEAILICTLMLLSCQGKDGAMGPAGPLLGEFISAIYSTGGSRFTPSVFIGFDQCRDIPSAVVNGHDVNYQFSSYLLSDDIFINPSDSVFISIYFTKVNGDEGYSYAALAMPNPATIINPDTSEIVPLQPEEDLAVTWHSATNASSYNVYYSIRMEYYLEQYDRRIQYNNALISTVDTNFVLPYSFMLPGTYYSIVSIGGFLELYSRHEPSEPSDSTDFHGDGYGFVSMCSYSSRVEFQIEGF